MKINGFITLAIIFYNMESIKAAKKCPDRPSPNPFAAIVFDATRKSENFCKTLGLSHKSRASTTEDKKANKEWDTCKNQIMPYFKEVEEDDRSIEQFAVGACIYVLNTDAIPCIDVIKYLEGICYNMNSAYDLIASLGKERYSRIGEYGSIKLQATDWDKFRSVGFSLNLQTCVTEFMDDYTKKIEVLEIYSKWWDNYKYTSKQDCTCTEVFGMNRIFTARKIAHKDTSLTNYFEEMCLMENNKKHHWNKQHYLSVSESKYDINLRILKEFLLKGIPLIEAGWGETMKSFNEWSFDDIYEATDMKSDPKEISDVTIKLISHAIKSGFTSDDYRQFLMTTAKEGYGTIECRQLILNELFDIEKSKLALTSDNTRNKHYWVKNEKTIFNEQLNILLQIHKNSNNSDTSCFGLLNTLKRFKQIIYRTIWASKDITELLNIIKKEQNDVDSMLNCLSYCEEIESRISFLNMLRPKEKLHVPESWQLSDDYVSQLAKFRKIFLEKPDKDTREICTYNDVKYNTGSRPNIILMMNFIVFNDENKYKTLQELFDNQW